MNRSTLLSLVLLVACFNEDAPMLPSGTSGESSTSSSTTTTSSSSTTTGTDTSSSTSQSEPSSSSSEASDPDTSSSSGSSPISDWALYFDGEAAAASSDAVDLDLGPDFTVEAWIRVDSADATGPIIVFRGVGTTGWSLEIEAIQSRLVFGFFDNNGAWNEVVGTDLAALDPGWHHVAGTKQAASLYLHVDGSVASTQACAEGVSAPIVPLTIGTSADASLVYLGIDDVRVSSIARYDGSFTPEAELVADPSTRVLLQIDEGQGSAIFDDVASIPFELQGMTWIPGNTAGRDG